MIRFAIRGSTEGEEGGVSGVATVSVHTESSATSNNSVPPVEGVGVGVGMGMGVGNVSVELQENEMLSEYTAALQLQAQQQQGATATAATMKAKAMFHHILQSKLMHRPEKTSLKRLKFLTTKNLGLLHQTIEEHSDAMDCYLQVISFCLLEII